MQVQSEQVVLATPSGEMQVRVFQPQPATTLQQTNRYSAVLLYSEIFQLTGPIVRMATFLSGQGLIVLVPEIFHEYNPMGTVLGYDDAGKDKGNQDKWQKPLTHYDADNEALLAQLASMPTWNGKVGAMGVCIGGHLAYRAALQPSIHTALCLYPTDLHSDTLPCGRGVQTLARTKEIQGQLVLVFGQQDPHIDASGRLKIYQQLVESGVSYQWHEVQAQHAFMRDEGERYDPALALWVYQMVIGLFR